jgi:hypothetical protein
MKLKQLLGDTQPQMNSLSSLDYFGDRELGMLAAEVLEQARAAPEQHGHEMDRDLIRPWL